MFKCDSCSFAVYAELELLTALLKVNGMSELRRFPLPSYVQAYVINERFGADMSVTSVRYERHFRKGCANNLRPQ